jgi:hypothetical protein
LDALAMAYAEAGQFSKAFEASQLAAKHAVAAGDRRLAQIIRGRAALYAENKPYRMQMRIAPGAAP